MSIYDVYRRKYYRQLRLPKDVVKEIVDMRNIRNKRGLSPMRNVVFTVYWNEGGKFNARVLGDDMSDIPFIVDVNVDDDEIRDTQEFMLFEWMRGSGLSSLVDRVKGRSLILAFAKKGKSGYTEEDILVFYDFGNFNDSKIENIKRYFGKN